MPGTAAGAGSGSTIAEMDLFDGDKTEYRLFDSMRMRFVPGIGAVRLTAREAREANERFRRASCPHLEWKTGEEQRIRKYTIKR